jgi:hypothetical protein
MAQTTLLYLIILICASYLNMWMYVTSFKPCTETHQDVKGGKKDNP